MAQTKQVVLTTTVKAASPIVANRFVNFENKQAKAGEAVLGVSPYDCDEGDTAAVDVIGIALVEAGGAVAAGVEVGADAQGCAVTGAAKVAGTALTAAEAAGDIIRVLLKG
ncbi:DUF2190 family protein [Neisseria animalis]|uniref:DUF2190 domain-containing protein n=1 Tax=Neisseria animalis TaxID=492 RepID=A0A5P3MTJ2_NEIAN|nr:DUF2190 family protein [Neisseria animalis]QEY24936.1 DUF2190 domain-containing protein [Neisseria animalis]ROW32247.1 DUF2190 domain-containing protein [Neisseria animalis]VEE09186.1 phage protein [Neisseria animalis]